MRRLALGALTLAIGLGVQSVRADDTHALATEHVRKANALYDQKKFEAARAEYAAACDLVPNDKCFRGLAQTEFDSGRFLDAYGHLKRIEAHKGTLDAMPAKMREDFIKLREAAFQRTGHVAVDAPAKARVSFDGIPEGIAPLTDVIDTTPGEHTVEANVDGAVVRLTVVALAGSIVQAHVGTAPSTPEPTPSSSAPPTAAVVTTAPSSSTAGGVAGAPATIAQPGWSTGKKLGVVLAGGAVVAFAGGVLFGAKSSSNANQVESLHSMLTPGDCGGSAAATCQSLSNAVDAQGRDATVSRILWGAGAALAVGAVASWFLWPAPHDTTSASVVPAVGPHDAGFQLSGRF
jgi:hypothetical protein